MRKVLIIASDFVPSSLPPATRVRFFAKHLPEFDWEPIVLTVDPTHYEAAVDEENRNLISPSLKVIRTGAFGKRWTRKIGIGDIGMRSLWQHWKVVKGLCRSRAIDLIFIPVPPYVPMVLGRLAHARFGIPYVVDYIDPWVTDYYWKLPRSQRPPKWIIADALSRIVEPFALKRVAEITGVSKGTTEMVRSRYPWLSRVPATEIPYGAESADFDYVRTRQAENQIFDRNDGHFHVSCIGRGGPDTHAALRAVFEAVNLGLKVEPEVFSRLRMHFVGTTYASNGMARCQVMPLAEEMSLDRVVTEHPSRVSYLDSLQLMLDSNALLALGSDETHYTASKIFPYLLSGKPLLAVFHEDSSVVRILKESNVEGAVTFNSERGPGSLVNEIVARLNRILLLEAGHQHCIEQTAFDAYTTTTLTSRLAASFERIVTSAREPGLSTPAPAKVV